MLYFICGVIAKPIKYINFTLTLEHTHTHTQWQVFWTTKHNPYIQPLTFWALHTVAVKTTAIKTTILWANILFRKSVFRLNWLRSRSTMNWNWRLNCEYSECFDARTIDHQQNGLEGVSRVDCRETGMNCSANESPTSYSLGSFIEVSWIEQKKKHTALSELRFYVWSWNFSKRIIQR